MPRSRIGRSLETLSAAHRYATHSVVRDCDEPGEHRVGINLEDAGDRTNPQAFRQRAHRPHELFRRHARAMQWRAVGLLEITATAGAMQLSPRATARMPVGPNITQPEPAAIATVGIGTEMARGMHLAAAAARGDDVGWWGTGGLRARRGGVLTRIARGLVGEARKGLRDTAGLAGW